MRVLDVGCGPGRLTIPVAEKVGPQGQVVAIDIQPGMLRRAQERAKTANLNNIRFLQTGAGEGKLERSQYDRALLVTVLGEIPNREAALKEIWNALKPGGFLSGNRNHSGSPFSASQHSPQVGQRSRVQREGIFWE